MVAPAVVCWAAHLGWLYFAGTKLAFIPQATTLVIFTLLAFVELTVDKLPKTPARTEPLGLIGRIVSGCLCGIALAIGNDGSLLVAAMAGAVGGLVGTFLGYNVRHTLVVWLHLPDFGLALAEDVVAVAGGLLIVSHL